MKRKIISCVLIFSFLSYIGCYNTEMVTKEELAASKGNAAITVVTKDRRQYAFEAGKYNLTADSLWGTGVRKLGGVADVLFQGPLPLVDIALIEATEFSTGKTILLAGATIGFVALIASASSGSSSGTTLGGGGKFSCPFIYTFDGAEYHFESETFAGAVFKGIERMSYDVLHHLTPVNGACRLKLVNAREETEYVDELKLIAVDHPKGTAVISDRSGVLHTISNPVRPKSCVDFRERNSMMRVSEKDGSYWQSDLTERDWTNERDLRDGLIVEFEKPSDAKSVKLVVSGKNTRLGYFALAKIFEMKGSEKLEWYRELESDPVERSKFARWLMREGMLHIQIWQNGKWIEKAAFPDVGPGISKDQVAVLDISNVTDDVLKVRLQCTTDLWCIDQVYADFSPDYSIRSMELPLRSAINERDQDVANLLNASDGHYYITINDQYADLTFADVPKQQDMKRSYVASTKGFYYQWLQSEERAYHELVERMLTEPMFGAKVLMPQWMKKRGEYEGISQVEQSK